MVSSDTLVLVGPAIVAGLMIAATHAPLGIEVLKRGIIFIDLAIAQLAGLGVVVAFLVQEHPSLWLTQSCALSFALLGAAFFNYIERRSPKLQEAIIGCAYVLASSIALMLLTGRPHGGEEVEQLLSGQILFVTWKQVLLHAPVYATIMFLWFRWARARQGVWFYVLFSAAITSSVQLVGVFLVFASLIAPALGSLGTTRMPRLVKAYGVGLTALILGFATALFTDLPAGPVLVVWFIIAAFLWSTDRNSFISRSLS
jgi:zinc/manganese transport system permease protein